MGIGKFPSAPSEVLGVDEKRKVCTECPSFQMDPCFRGGSGDNPAHLIVVGRAPSVYSLGSEELFQGSEGRLFKNFFQKEIFPRYPRTDIKIFFTYAALGGRIGLTANHTKCCLPNLYRDLERVSHPETGGNPVIVTLGPEPLKSLGINVRKILDAVGKIFTTTIQTSTGSKTFEVVPLLSMEHLDAQPGVARTMSLSLQKAVKLALRESKPMDPNTSKNYIVATSIEEVTSLVEKVINYSNPDFGPKKSVPIGPDNWNIALDTETNTLYPFSHEDPRVLMLSVAWDAQEAGVILLDHEEVKRTPEEREQVLAQVKRLLTCSKPKAFHNWKFDQKFLEGVLGIQVYRVAWDTLLAEHFLDEDKKGLYSLKKLTPIYAPQYQAYDDELQGLLRQGNKREEKEYSDEELLELSSYGPPIFVETEEQRVRWNYLVKKLEEKAQTQDRKLKNKRSIMKAIKDEIKKSREFLGITQEGKGKKSKDGSYEKVPLDVLGKYAATDADVTRILCNSQVRIAADRKELPDLKKVLKDIYLPASRTLSQMEYRGFRIDQDYLSSLEKEVASQLEVIRGKMHTLIGESFNLNGPTQVSNAMQKLGFEPLPGLDSIDSTAKGILDKYTQVYPEGDQRHEFAELMIQYRECHKTGKSFLKPIREFSKKDGKVHCEFNLNGTATGRLSSSDPNLQNIPAVTAMRIKNGPNGERIVVHPGYNIKKLFVPSEKGKVIVNCDISGAELRVLTAYTKDSSMVKAFNDGMDFHSYTTSRIYKIPYEEVQAKRDTDKEIKKKRKKAKTLVFCTIYGGGPGRISQQAECSFEEAKDLQSFLFQVFPKVPEYIANTEREVRTLREVRTMFGRRRRFPLVGISQKHTADAIREAVNFKIQSTSSDIVLSQLIEIDENIKDIGGSLLITVHDSYVLEIPEKNIDLLKPFFDEHITASVQKKNWLPVPFLYDLEVGPSYGETKEVKK